MPILPPTVHKSELCIADKPALFPQQRQVWVVNSVRWGICDLQVLKTLNEYCLKVRFRFRKWNEFRELQVFDVMQGMQEHTKLRQHLLLKLVSFFFLYKLKENLNIVLNLRHTKHPMQVTIFPNRTLRQRQQFCLTVCRHPHFLSCELLHREF